MKRLLILIFMISLLPVPASSQAPSPEIQWTSDWEVEQDVAIMELDSETYMFELILEFWINNNRLTPIEVDFDVEFEEVEFEVDDPGQVSVDGNSNNTFELKIMGTGLKDAMVLHNADEFRETVTLKLIEMVAGQAADSSREISQDLEFSKLYDIRVEYEAGGFTSLNAQFDMKSGTSKEINLQVFNLGNSADAVTKHSISVSRCPQLDFSFEPTASLPMAVNPALNKDDGVMFGTLQISASSSHPTKECKVEFSVFSEATSFSSYATLTVDVESVENEVDDDKDSDDSSDTTEAKDLESESTSLPAISSVLCALTVLLCAIIRRE